MEPTQASDDLQFDKADVSESDPGPLTCHACERTLHDAYFEVSGQPSCEKCRYEAEERHNQGSGAGRFGRAVVGGGFAGLLGAGIYYAVLALTGYEVGLVAIVVGFLVGFGVRWGSRGRGGRPYQLLAVGITYLAIVSTYVPFIFEEMGKMEAAEVQPEDAAATSVEVAEPPAGPEDAAVLGAPANAPESAGVEEEITLGQALFGLAIFGFFVLAIPFLGGFENIIGILIIGFGLYQAWKINTRTALVIEGPFQVGQANPAPVEPSGT